MAWTVTLYKATADTGAGTPYDTISIATLTGYTGYATIVTTILAPQGTWANESFVIKDVSGNQFGRIRRRRAFDVECRPFVYNDSADVDHNLTDVDDITDFLDDASYIWVRIDGGSRTYPASAGVAHPVICTGWSESINKDAGTRGLSIQLEHRYRF